jgi:hypothetical protein
LSRKSTSKEDPGSKSYQDLFIYSRVSRLAGIATGSRAWGAGVPTSVFGPCTTQWLRVGVKTRLIPFLISTTVAIIAVAELQIFAPSFSSASAKISPPRNGRAGMLFYTFAARETR